MREIIFKGSTRPAMLFGIPLIPFVVVAGGSTLLSVWASVLASRWIALAIAFIACSMLAWARQVSRRDDQRLSQHWLAMLLRTKNRNDRLWRGRSYSPTQCRGTYGETH